MGYSRDLGVRASRSIGFIATNDKLLGGHNLKSIELFAGAGGLALGVSKAGFHHEAIIERDRWACDTIRRNKARGVPEVVGWPDPFQGDVRDYRYGKLNGSVDLVSGGPPCQPFSIGGKHGGFTDARDMFPEAARAIRELQPRGFIFENVRGLLRPNFSEYFEYIILRLSYPEVIRKESEEWNRHLLRLRKHRDGGSQKGLVYRVSHRALNAADYGVPQSRVRVFMIGVRADLKAHWEFPAPICCEERLIWDQWITGEYWDEHKVPRKQRPSPSIHALKKRKKIEGMLVQAEISRWRTVRDAIGDLPEPSEKAHGSVLNHKMVPGARVYPGHTGSPLDLPAKTLKAGVHGVPGGENMLARYDGSVRYFTVREAARLQCFPDNYELGGAWSECMRQLGNAVPVALAELLTSKLRSVLNTSTNVGKRPRMDREIRSEL